MIDHYSNGPLIKRQFHYQLLCTVHYHTRLAFGYPLCPVVLFAETTKSTLSRRLSLDHRLKRPTTICLLISIYFSARCDVCEVSVGINMPRGCFSFLSRDFPPLKPQSSQRFICGIIQIGYSWFYSSLDCRI